MTSSPSKYSSQNPNSVVISLATPEREHQAWWVFGAASFLVSVPVFFQAPIVRLFPSISLLLTLVWVVLGWFLYRRSQTRWWGDLILGFSWSWLAGSIYWGWFRWEPLIHLPIEAVGLPFALLCLWRGWGKVGNYFYLGSLLGTAITDVYFYLTDLIPYWRKLMDVDPALASPILKSALAQMQTPWGLSWAVVLVNLLLGITLCALQNPKLHWWAFGGAVLSTLVVDSLFWIAAYFA
ncbi:conserved membrane hypothetical protein [Hyella patelloides LEGE 07179]|uniref:DUF3120 domain-containing protein n=1 Tax=Hyella patelloides LEGE 07179 TaxID=945734 RepID=A0A563W3B5_9CYAN|nr:DUF3120 domain-containing protein [Hyella patelloides]VEP18188.1 conserved membrane hypothetical protein [Hyella patelloides LEGE 07179]